MSSSPNASYRALRMRVLRAVLLVLWALASFGASFFARDLQFTLGAWLVGYWIAAQGSLVVFTTIVVAYAWAANRWSPEDDAGTPSHAGPADA